VVIALVLLSDPARFSSFFVKALLSPIARSKAFRTILVLGLFHPLFLPFEAPRVGFMDGENTREAFRAFPVFEES